MIQNNSNTLKQKIYKNLVFDLLYLLGQVW